MQRARATLLVLTALLMVHSMMKPGNAITCSQVESYLTSCVFYLIFGGHPSDDCCKGVRRLQANTPTIKDRQKACQCCKDVTAQYLFVSDNEARSLPGKCGVELNIPILRNVWTVPSLVEN